MERIDRSLIFWIKIGEYFFSEKMDRNRFCEIVRFLRFDLLSTRLPRLQTNKFALISAVWDKFVENSMVCFKPGENITVDEQLFPTKARCRFTQFTANKPDKFGIKFWIAVDLESKSGMWKRLFFNRFRFRFHYQKTRKLTVDLSKFVIYYNQKV